METLHNGFTLELCPGAFPLSTDSIALSHFACCKANDTVLDLCSGCGTLGLLLCAANDTCCVTGVEIDENAHLQALKNAADNQIQHRLTSICADVASVPQRFAPGSFSVCVANPPYFTGGPKSSTLPNARREDLCTLETLMQAAQWALKFGGDFYLVHRPERLAEIFATAVRHTLEPKKLLLLRHTASSPVTLVLVQCRKGGKPGLLWQEEFLFDNTGNPSNYYRRLYHI